MNAELIAVLEHMEREKGVSRSVLIEAIETALVSAAKKVLREKETEVEVKIDPITGDIDVFSDGEKLQSKEFGRIAAQTAKQVIIQKIRDAERDVVFEEFEPKINQIVSGTVFRYDKGTVIIDLGKTEAVLPKREQSPRDVYRQGDRVRVYILEVGKSIRGPQIVVSRTHPGLVKRLFEMEVPEVLDSIVEIKNVSREPGDRAKIAVWSKDEKVDCVGACVGMRGSRVKNIVRELQGEKIDIVRWNESIAEYVKAALSPAECATIEVVSQEDRKIKVIVDDDQLSLAIGKNGQNVRLASRLTEWDIDIRSKYEAAKIEELKTQPLSDLSNLETALQEMLTKAGIESQADLVESNKDKIEAIEGITEEQVVLIRELVAELLKKPEPQNEEVADEGEASSNEKGEQDSVGDSVENSDGNESSDDSNASESSPTENDEAEISKKKASEEVVDADEKPAESESKEAA